jgi:hypothetical protein
MSYYENMLSRRAEVADLLYQSIHKRLKVLAKSDPKLPPEIGMTVKDLISAVKIALDTDYEVATLMREISEKHELLSEDERRDEAERLLAGIAARSERSGQG